MSTLEKIRELVISDRVIYRYHSVTEKLIEINLLRNLNLNENDIVCVIMTGEIVEVFDNDRRGRRYAIRGFALDDETVLEIVCRIKGDLVIITVYEPYY